MIFDILIFIVVLVSAVIAFFRGLIREILTIFGVAGSLIAAYLLGPVAIPFVYGLLGIDPEADEPQKLMDVVPYTLVGDALTYGAIFLIFMIILSLFSHAVSESAKSLGLGAIDRTLGFIFGIARGVAIVALLYLPIHIFVDQETKTSWFDGSRTFFYVEYTAELFTEFIPEDQLPSQLAEGEGEENPLKEIKILDSLIDQVGEATGGSENEESKVMAEDEQKTAAPTNTTQGYDEQFRDTMDRLFEDATDPVTDRDNNQSNGQAPTNESQNETIQPATQQ